MKNIILGVLCGTIIALVCTVIRLDIELEEAERLLDDPVIRFPNKCDLLLLNLIMRNNIQLSDYAR